MPGEGPRLAPFREDSPYAQGKLGSALRPGAIPQLCTAGGNSHAPAGSPRRTRHGPVPRTLTRCGQRALARPLAERRSRRDGRRGLQLPADAGGRGRGLARGVQAALWLPEAALLGGLFCTPGAGGSSFFSSVLSQLQ